MYRDTLSLFAEAQVADPPKRTEPFLQKPEDWVGVGLLVAALLAGALLIWLLERWRKNASGAANRAGYGQLSDYREMFDRGEITAEEYERLRLKVAERVKPVSPPAQAAEPQPPPNPGGQPETPGRDSPA